MTHFFTVGSLIILLIINAGNCPDTRDRQVKAPNFYLHDLDGNAHFLNDFCGEKRSAYKKNEKNVVLISFFATWCLPCREEYPIFEKLSKYYSQKRFKIFLIDVEEKEEIVRDFAAQRKIRLPVLLDRYGVAKKKYEITTVPQLFLIDPAQYIVFEKSGFERDFPLFRILQTKIDSLLHHHFEPDQNN